MANRLVFEEGKVLKAIVDAVEALIGEASIKLSPEEGMSLSALDTSKTAMIQLILPKSYFVEYEVEEEGFYGINFTELSRVLKRVKAKDRVELVFDESRLILRAIGDYRKTFSMPMLAGESFELRELKVQFKAGARVDSKVLPDVIKDLKLISNEIKISIDSDKLEFMAQSDRGESTVELNREDILVIDIWAEEPSSSYYSLAYLEKMAKPAKIAEEASIEISSQSPMKLTYPLGGVEGARIVYYLAHISVA